MEVIITFHTSRSKYFPGIMSLGKKFNSVSTQEGKTTAVFSFEEIIEKWDMFNTYFWTVAKWTSSVVELDGTKFGAYNDKTAIFYDIQRMKQDIMANLREKMIKEERQTVIEAVSKAFYKKARIHPDRLDKMDDEEINAYIDMMREEED